MLINDVSCSPHVAGLIEGVSDAANQLGLLISVMPTLGEEAAEAAVLDHIAAMEAKGVIYARLVLAMRDAAADPALVVKGGWTIASGDGALRRLRQLADPPTAVFCFCDRMAVRVCNAAGVLGLRIPQDLSVVGFDDESFTADKLPPLTTMDLPHTDMARHAVEELHRLMVLPGSRPRHPRMKFDCPMMTRRSIAPPEAALRRLEAAGSAWR